MYNLVTLETLYGKSSTGKIKQWTISVFKTSRDDNATSVIRTEHGYVGQKITTVDKNIYVGKNLGKSNATTAYEQALSEARSTYEKKIDKQYRTSIEELELGSFELELPMLAHEFNKRGHDIEYPCFVQPKLNGVRCLTKKMDEYGSMRASSRGGKLFHAVSDLMAPIGSEVSVGWMTDGELYNHNLTFEEITTAIKNEEEHDVNLDKIEYWIYDLPCEHDFDRRAMAMALFVIKLNNPKIKLVPTFQCNNKEEVMRYHRTFISEGYEGTMIRNMKGAYDFKNRSKNLQKHKDFIDGEFEIVGGQEGTGLSEGQCTFICKTEDGKEFGVRCKGANSVREEQLVNLANYIGKKLTVKYQNLSDDGIPIFPVGITVRDYE